MFKRNFAENKQRSYRITGMHILASSGKEKPDTKDIIGLILAAAKLTRIEVIRADVGT
jgi:hypothetical protein